MHTPFFLKLTDLERPRLNVTYASISTCPGKHITPDWAMPVDRGQLITHYSQKAYKTYWLRNSPRSVSLGNTIRVPSAGMLTLRCS